MRVPYEFYSEKVSLTKLKNDFFLLFPRRGKEKRGIPN